MIIFISHPKKDEALAAALVKFLMGAMKIDESQIRCTSVPGYKLPVGAHSSDTLRREIDESSAFIGIITTSSIASSYVLFELERGLPLSEFCRYSSYLMTPSALASTCGGIVRPICFAVLRLIINSNFVGCSNGRSAGFAPFRILSTYVAARR